ncbi:MAG: TFIIH/NER complex subunit [Alyxoria varia]|nr:MAG: TFIIH/NER complex subunit [Alyxoria varia]
MAKDICPVCKSSRYMNPNMRFLVNPDCYHKMCESCVDRIFSSGPSQCPVAGCNRHLRKHKFRKQTFDDILVEKEVDIRKRVAEIMNRRENDFESLRDYNDYLETVENLTFNLANGIDIAATEKALNEYKEKFGTASIRANERLARDELAAAKATQAAEREEHKLKRGKAMREMEEEKRLREKEEQEIVNKLTKADSNISAEEIARQIEKLRQERMRRQHEDDDEDGTTGSYAIRGLKSKATRAAEAMRDEDKQPYDPFAGLAVRPKYFNLKETWNLEKGTGGYEWDYITAAKKDVHTTAGGYDVHYHCYRALRDGFAGLGVFVADEMSAMG